jgi:hypothetical protein
VQLRPVAGELLDVIVDCAPQLLGVGAVSAAVEDEVAGQPVELSEVCGDVRGARLFIELVPRRSLKEFQHGGRHVLEFDEATAQLIRDIRGHIARPSLGRVEGDDASWTHVMAFDQVSQQSRTIAVLFCRFGPGPPQTAAEVLKHNVDIAVGRTLRNDGWRVSHENALD